ncbi:MAG: carbamoyltransferase family protein [Bdellovibrionota bacterium]
MKILGISAYYHDSAAALLVDGEILAAAQEERFTRLRHDARMPLHAIEFCLAEAGITLSEVDYVAFYDKPFLKFERLLETYLATAPFGFSAFRESFPIWVKEKLFQKRLLGKELGKIDPNFDWKTKLLFSEHHLSHAASAFFPSPFAEAAVLTLDGVGEWTTTSLAVGKGAELKVLKEIHFPHSLGLLYAAFTAFAGFKVNSGEYKLMGLAPYGKPIFREKILQNLIDVKADGSFRLNQKYFGYSSEGSMTNSHFAKLFGVEARAPEDTLTQVYMDLAASVQAVTEEVVLKLAAAAAKETGMKNICLAGGVALNCVANGKLLKAGAFENVWVQPAAGDAGGALGAALAAQYLFLKQPRHLRTDRDSMRGAFLGPSFGESEVIDRLKEAGARFEELEEEKLLSELVDALAIGKAVGWMQGKMEFGPRALGARSILADPRSVNMQTNLNLKVKFRESFRPFAPAVLEEKVSEWFEFSGSSPYMMFVADVLPKHRLSNSGKSEGLSQISEARSSIPAITHVDYSARLQTVDAQTNPRFHRLLQKFYERTGCPVLINTSFNVRGEPIVCTPEDAFACFLGTNIDLLAVENCLLRKEDQDLTILRRHSNREFAPD